MREPLPKITGILLAGGKSSRMNRDKEIGQDKGLSQDKKLGQDKGLSPDKGLIPDEERFRDKGRVRDKGLIPDEERFRDKDKVRDKGLSPDEERFRDKDKVRDKGMIRLGKFLMYQYPLKVLESLCDEILISTCNPMKIEEDYEQVCDKIPGIGPIGGVATCLERSSNDLNIILSYDLPLINRELFIELLKYSTLKSSTYDVILPAASPDRPEPLCGIYRKSTIPVLHHMIDQGIFAMHKLIPQVRAKILPVGAADPFYHDRLFKNINTESDLSGLPEHLR